MSLREEVIDVKLTPALDTDAYASGDAMGALMSFDFKSNRTGAIRKSGVLIGVTVIDKAEQSKAFDIEFFSKEPTAQTDNAAVNFPDSDATNWLSRVSVAAGDYKDIGGFTCASINLSNTSNHLIVGSGQTVDSDKVYVQLVARDAPTYAANSLIIRLHILLD